MANELPMSATVTRTQLGLPPLQLNDGVIYRCSTSAFLGGQVQWTRNQVSSIYIDGSVTVARQRQIVNENIAFEVSGVDGNNLNGPPNQSAFQKNMAVLIAAFSQDSFTLDLILGDVSEATHYTYLCEAADVQVTWTTPRFVAKQGLVTFTVPRQPVPVAGGV